MIKAKKIIVVGCSGSGKSYFSNVLSKITNLPVYHLDVLYWKPNWVPTPREEFRKIIKDVMDSDEWIIDGNYNGTIEDRFEKAELIYFLDLPTEVCLESEKERRGNKRDDFPDYLQEKEDLEFVEFIKNFKDTGKVKILSLIDKYPNVHVVTFKSREEINTYLKMKLFDDVINKYKRKNQILFSRDSLSLQPLLNQIRKQKHRTIVLWAFKCIDRIASELETRYPNELRPKMAIDLCKNWAQGDVLMPIAKKALLEVHQIAKEINDPVDIALYHAIGQGCAVVHVETHAIGIAVYELTALVRKYGIYNFAEGVQNKINQYIEDLYACEEEIESTEYKWANFLLKETTPNKEQQLYDKGNK